MAAISGRKPPVIVEYDSRGKRVQRYFEDPFAARRFYCQKVKSGNQPKVLATKPRSNDMATAKKTTSKKTATKKTTTKKTATKKPAVKKATKKTATKKTAAVKSALADNQRAVLRLLRDGKQRDRNYLKANSGLSKSANWTGLMRALDEAGYVLTERVGVMWQYEITALGKKALAAK